MCEVRLIRVEDEDGDVVYRVDLAGYQKEIKTVCVARELEAASNAVESWLKLTGWKLANYEEVKTIETKLLKVERFGGG